MGLTVPQPLLIAADEIVQYRAESAAGGPSKVRSTLAPVLKYWVLERPAVRALSRTLRCAFKHFGARRAIRSLRRGSTSN